MARDYMTGTETNGDAYIWFVKGRKEGEDMVGFEVYQEGVTEQYDGLRFFLNWRDHVDLQECWINLGEGDLHMVGYIPVDEAEQFQRECRSNRIAIHAHQYNPGIADEYEMQVSLAFPSTNGKAS